MEYKYSTINEVNHFEFGEAVVGDIQLTERMFHPSNKSSNVL